jgi:putative oxidoreductase
MKHDLILLISRLLIAPIMVVYGIDKLSDISNFIKNPATIRLMEMIAQGATAPLWLAYCNAIFQFAIGVLVLIGFKTRLSAALVALWLIPVTYLGHPFWAGINPAFNEAQFYKNLAIIAAYLLIATYGAGRFSIDRLISRR